MFDWLSGFTSPRGSPKKDVDSERDIRDKERDKGGEKENKDAVEEKEPEKEKEPEAAAPVGDEEAPPVGSHIMLLNAQKVDLSNSIKMAIKHQSMMVDEMRKERVMDIIRRDLGFKQVFESALEGNSERSWAPRYRQLYEAYKNIYKVHIFEEKIVQEPLPTKKGKKKEGGKVSLFKKKKKRNKGDGQGEEGDGGHMSKEEARKKLKVLNADLQQKLVIAESLDSLLNLQQDPVERNKAQEALNILNEDIMKLEAKIAEATGYSYGVSKNQRLIELDIKWSRDNLSNTEISGELIKIQQKLRARNEQKILISGGKRQVLGQAEAQVVTWESKTEKQLVDLFGSKERAVQIKNMNKEEKDKILARIVMQMEELSKQEKAIAYHFGFCTEILKRASDMQHMEDLITRLKSVAKRNKEVWTREATDKLEKEKEASEKRKSGFGFNPASPQKEDPRDSGQWSFADLVKEAKGNSPAPQPATSPASPTSPPPAYPAPTPAAASPYPLAHLKLLLTPASRGSLYKIKEDDSAIIRQMLLEEEETFHAEQRLAAEQAAQKLEPVGTEVQPTNPSENPTEPVQPEKEAPTETSPRIEIVVQDTEGDTTAVSPRRRNDMQKQDEEEIQEVLQGSISEVTFQLLKAQEHLLWKDDPRKDNKRGTTLSPDEDDSRVRMRVTKSARRRARRKRKKQETRQKMKEEQEREQLVEKVMRMVQGNQPPEAEGPERINEEDKHLWDVTCGED